jgi:hypothetical protein
MMRKANDALRRRLADARAWANALWKRYAAKWANKRPAGTKPMLDILRLPMTKETLSKMTPEERSLFLLLGYASNQVNALWKLVIITTNSTPDDEEARGGLDRLKKRFGPSNPLATIRNNYAFHHPTMEQMEAAFQLAASNKDGEDVDWSVFFNRALLNTFFFVSDYVLVHGIADILKESDVNVAHEKLLRDLAPIANDLSEFMFGFAKAIFQKYIGGEELVLTVVAKIANAPDINDLHLPFYVETPGLPNG